MIDHRTISDKSDSSTNPESQVLTADSIPVHPAGTQGLDPKVNAPGTSIGVEIEEHSNYEDGMITSGENRGSALASRGSTMELESEEDYVFAAKTCGEESNASSNNGQSNTSSSYIRAAEPDSRLPHLSMHKGKNLISVLDRCDPEKFSKCYSCGYDNTKGLSHGSSNDSSNKTVEPTVRRSNRIKGFRNSIDEDEDCYWNMGESNNFGWNASYSNGQEDCSSDVYSDYQATTREAMEDQQVFTFDVCVRF